jgi:hypothetical protein
VYGRWAGKPPADVLREPWFAFQALSYQALIEQRAQDDAKTRAAALERLDKRFKALKGMVH